MAAMLAACGGFLLGVLWMDLLFDIAILGAAPQQAVEKIAAYYARATIEAYPMNRLIGAVMLLTVGGASYQVVRGTDGRGDALLALLLVLVPVALALGRVFPDAVRLGERSGSAGQQIFLARRICLAHLACLISVGIFVALQIRQVAIW
jgi:hypothetical protein